MIPTTFIEISVSLICIILQLHVTTPDGKPINNENITITVHNEKRKKLFKRPFRAMNGIINFKIPDIPLQVKKLYLKVSNIV